MYIYEKKERKMKDREEMINYIEQRLGPYRSRELAEDIFLDLKRDKYIIFNTFLGYEFSEDYNDDVLLDYIFK